MKLSKKELEKRTLEYRMVYMRGYTDGYRDAMPMHEFVDGLMQLMDMKNAKRIREWSEKEYQRLKEAKKKKSKKK